MAGGFIRSENLPLKARLSERKPEENPTGNKTEKKEEKKKSSWNVGKKTKPEEKNKIKSADLPRIQTAAVTDHGLLLANTGGVVFLDEIGEANAVLQAKLLAYLDDYRVRPRKWKGEPFYCPTLIVAATNRDLTAMVERKEFREDLLARFSDHHVIPPLRQRMEDLSFILDCLLQSEAINPEASVAEIGSEAVATLINRVTNPAFKGNFRELETVLRTACQRAARDGRNFICSIDLAVR